MNEDKRNKPNGCNHTIDSLLCSYWSDTKSVVNNVVKMKNSNKSNMYGKIVDLTFKLILLIGMIYALTDWVGVVTILGIMVWYGLILEVFNNSKVKQ